MSEKYIIDVSKCLGKGATAEVFVGFDLKNGCQYALKCSNKHRNLDKEISTMKELDHKNIIKFYDSLNDFGGYNQVIVMEYCNRGSLYDFSELHQGLCDNMFLKVLECLNDGMFYLREREIIHRDIKPGNIMMHHDNLGYYHVKLGDLGTAKQVADDQDFMSMVGTEAYLHPNMYIKYLENLSGKFNVNVDLWSMGVTLYHAAVTELPFKTFESRTSSSSKNMLSKMYTTKKPGIISGIQNSISETDITWSDQLPEKCRFSTMLKDLASRLIGNLMDLNVTNSFDRFFKESNNILQKKRFLIFNSSNGELQIIYLDNSTFKDVLDQISNVINLPKEDIIILTKNQQLQSVSDENIQCFKSMLIKGHTKYTLTDDTAMVITTKLEDDQAPLVCPPLLNYEFNIPSKEFHDPRKMNAYSLNILKAMNRICYSANYIDCQIDCYLATVNYFNEHILKRNSLLIYQCLPLQMESINDICTFTEYLISVTEEAVNSAGKFMSTHKSLSECQEVINKLRDKAVEGENTAEQCYNKIVIKQKMLQYSEKNFCKEADAISDDKIDCLVNLAEALVNEIKLMPTYKFNKSETYKLEIWQRHIRLLKYFEEAKELLNVKFKCIENMHKKFKSWLQEALVIMDRIDKLRNFICSQDKEKQFLRESSLKIKDFVLHVLEGVDFPQNTQVTAPVDVDKEQLLKYSIIELNKLTEKIKKKFYDKKLLKRDLD